MDYKDIITLISAILGFVTATLIPTIIVLIKQIRRVKQAKADAAKAKTEEEKQRAEAEKQAAINDIISLTKGFVAEAEDAYKGVEPFIKEKGGSCALAKKESVMTKVLRACIDKQLDFDEAFWSDEVESIVKVTKSVNAK